ncbi:hypothetical protein SUGI_0117870 [Cryptomeria japonica]|nr:hypothetical protein SUGI_0117870 [Cryptomeria japonica]
MAATRSKVLLLMLAIISWLHQIGAVSSNVAELERERWREKLPEVGIPQTVEIRLSPLSLTQMHNFLAGLKNMDATSFDAHQFCRSAGLICREDVSFPTTAPSDFGIPSVELRAVEEHVFFDKKELRESGEIVLPDLSPPNYLISFWPTELAEIMPPFSSANVSQILNLLNIPSESNMSRSMVGTLEMCEKRAEEGEGRGAAHP